MTNPAMSNDENKSAGDAVERRQVKPYTFRGEGTSRRQAVAWWLGRALSRVVSIFLFRLRVGGRHNIPAAGPVLMVSNHQSFLDPWLLGIGARRQLHYMARDTLFKGGFMHWLIERYNAFPIKRGSADRAALAMAVERLEKGFVVTIFPEGTRSEDGTIGPIAPGMSIILNRCKKDVMVLPVLIDGAFEAWPRNKKVPRPRAIRVFYGEPIGPAVWKELSADELAQLVRRRLVDLQVSTGSVHGGASRARLEKEVLEGSGRRSKRGQEKSGQQG